MPSADHRQTIQQLSQQMRRLERAAQPAAQSGRALSTGIPPLDGLLPGQGVLPGTLIEWLSAGAGSGAGMLTFNVAAQLVQDSGACVVIDPDRSFYPPAVLHLQDSRQVPLLERMIVVQPASERDALWSLEQSLRCPGVAVTLCWIDKLRSHTCRRLQLAVEAGGGIGMLLRPGTCRSQPSWADVRLMVEPRFCASSSSVSSASPSAASSTADSVPGGRQLSVKLLHCRGGISGGAVELELDDATGNVRLACRLATAADSYHAAGA